LDAITAHHIGAVQFQLGSAVSEVPLNLALLQGLDVLGDSFSSELAKSIREGFEERKLTMAAVDGTFNMVHPDVAHRSKGLGHLRRVIESCSELGTSVVTLCTGSRDDIMWTRHADNDGPEAWKDLVASMKEAARVAEGNDVSLAFEPEVNNVVNSAQKARRLIDEVGSVHVKVLMDPANIFEKGELPHMSEKLDEAFALVSEDIALAHAKDLDHDGEAGHLAAGRGRMDYSRYLSLLQRSGFEGAVVLHQMHGLSDDEVEGCFSFVRDHAPEGFFE
jgi:sugar phosphate isomerase/epimerase